MKKLIGLVFLVIVLVGCNQQAKTAIPAGGIDESMQKTDEGPEFDSQVNDEEESVIKNEGEELQSLIEAAFREKHPDWDPGIWDSIRIEINEVVGDYISGGVVPVEPGPGAGYFFAAKNSEGKWVIAADGNGTVMCDDIAPFDFPTSMIPQCFDTGTGDMVDL